MTMTVPPGSLMASALSAQDMLSTLADHNELTRAATGLLEAVASAGDVAVRPVGRGGSLIVGAASVIGGPALRHAPLGLVGADCSKVLLVEGVAVGHGVVERAVTQARQMGAEWVGAWVWRAGERLACDRIGADYVDVDGLLA